MQGELLSPDEIRFELSVDPQYAANDIQSAIQSLNSNESELNKQVISLMVFNSFMGADAPGDNRVSYAINNKARQTLGNLISQQLNKFSEQYIKGVNVNFDIQSYQSYDNQSSARTDVSLDVSRSMFNDRLTIQVGGSLEIEEGNNQGGQNYQANQIAGDFLLEYKLTPDGVYRFQAFRKNEYENVIDGLITQTGVALIFNKDFYKFKYLFKPETKTEESEENAEE